MSGWQFTVRDNRLMFICDDFENDAALTLTGDFGDEDNIDRFAQSLLAKLNTRATDAELERLRADLARVTAERDAAIVEAQQAAKDRALMKAQLDRAEVGRDRLRADLIAIQAAAEGISRTVNDSAGERLWAVKQIARAALNGEGDHG